MNEICEKCFGSKPDFCICTKPEDIPKPMPKWAVQGCLICKPPVNFKTENECKEHFVKCHRSM